MSKAILRFFNTAKYLKSNQLTYRVFYALYRPILKPFEKTLLRSWLGHWDAPLVMSACISDDRTITFLNETNGLDENFLWNDPKKSKLWLYNLHYFDDLNAIEACNRITIACWLIEKWVVENPSLQGNGWEPYPLSLRIVNWIKWFSRYPNEVESHWLTSLATQAEALYKQIEYHILGNHLFANAKALVFAGCYFDGPRANRWLNKGLKLLNQEIKEQFLCDGGHFERSPMYHAILLWDMCDLYNLAASTKLEMVVQHQPDWLNVIEKGLRWLSLMSHPDGNLSFFNDAAFGIAPRYEDILLYARQLGLAVDGAFVDGGDPSSQAPRDDGLWAPRDDGWRVARGESVNWQLDSLDESGYLILQKSPGIKAILDVGPIGPDYQPGHAHADTLSFELSLFSQRFMVNSGISEYGIGPIRQHQRSTKAHNTVWIDNQNSSDVWAGFRVGRRARPFGLVIEELHDKIAVECSHNGYIYLSGKNIHRRLWQFQEKKIIISDCISGNFNCAEARFYLHPSVMIVSINDKRVTCELSSGELVTLWLKGKGCLSVDSTHWYPEFGVSLDNTCIVAKFLDNELVMQIQW